MIIIRKKLAWVFILLCLFFIIFTRQYAYLTFKYPSGLKIEQHNSIIKSYEFIDYQKIKYYPIYDIDNIEYPCDEGKGSCYRFFATTKEIKMNKKQYELYGIQFKNPEKVKIIGFSIPIKDVNTYKFYNMYGDKGIDYFHPKFK